MSKSGKFDYLKKLTQAERKQILDMKKAQGEKKGQISKAETSQFLKNKGVSKLSDILKKQDLKQGFEKIRSEGLKRIPTVSDWLGDAIRQGEEELKKEEAKLTELNSKKFEKGYNKRKKLLDILKKQGLKQGLEGLEKNKRDKQIEEVKRIIKLEDLLKKSKTKELEQLKQGFKNLKANKEKKEDEEIEELDKDIKKIMLSNILKKQSLKQGFKNLKANKKEKEEEDDFYDWAEKNKINLYTSDKDLYEENKDDPDEIKRLKINLLKIKRRGLKTVLNAPEGYSDSRLKSDAEQLKKIDRFLKLNQIFEKSENPKSQAKKLINKFRKPKKEEEEEEDEDELNSDEIGLEEEAQYQEDENLKRLGEIDNDELQYQLSKNEIPPNLRNQIRHAEESKLDFLDNSGLTRAEIQQRQAQRELNLLQARAEEEERLKRRFQADNERYDRNIQAEADYWDKFHSERGEEQYDEPERDDYQRRRKPKIFKSIDEFLKFARKNKDYEIEFENAIDLVDKLEKKGNISEIEKALLFIKMTDTVKDLNGKYLGLSEEQRQHIENLLNSSYENTFDDNIRREANKIYNSKPIITNRGILAEPNTIYEEMGSVSKPNKFKINRAYGEDVSTFYPEAGLYGKEGLAQLRNKYNIEVPEHIRKLLKQKGK